MWIEYKIWKADSKSQTHSVNYLGLIFIEKLSGYLTLLYQTKKQNVIVFCCRPQISVKTGTEGVKIIDAQNMENSNPSSPQGLLLILACNKPAVTAHVRLIQSMCMKRDTLVCFSISRVPKDMQKCQVSYISATLPHQPPT